MAYTYTCISCGQPGRIPYNKPNLSTARLRVCGDCSALRPTPSSMANGQSRWETCAATTAGKRSHRKAQEARRPPA